MSRIRHPNGKKDQMYARIGEALTRLRQSRAIRIEDVTTSLGITTGALQKVEEGITCPLYLVAMLADFYAVSIADIVPSAKELAA